jgi:DUF1707 SHOCT-like domain
VLKAAFIQGRLTKDEFDLRVGQTLASRTYAELAAVTADLPPGLITAQPPVPALVPWFGRLVMGASAVEAGLWTFVFAARNSYADNEAVLLLVCSTTLIYVAILLIGGLDKLGSWRRQRLRGQSPWRPAAGAGGQAPQHLPSAGPVRQPPPGDDGH